MIDQEYPIGEKFSHLTVIARCGSDRFGRSLWRCYCDCGEPRIVALFRLRSGHTKSCGCIKGRSSHKHGMARTPTYNTWSAMKARCCNPSNDQFEHYGARGIKVCERWKASFEAFMADMGERPEGMTIDRIDNDGDYEAGNCRWAPETEQARNRRSTIKVERDGVTKCVKDWCDELGINVDRVYGRIRRGESPERAIR